MSSSVEVEYLYRALESRIGIIIRTNDPIRLRAKLYTARKTNPAFSDLYIKPSNSLPDEHLWVGHKSPRLEEPGNAEE
jgi:hypothetical protein